MSQGLFRLTVLGFSKGDRLCVYNLPRFAENVNKHSAPYRNNTHACTFRAE